MNITTPAFQLPSDGLMITFSVLILCLLIGMLFRHTRTLKRGLSEDEEKISALSGHIKLHHSTINELADRNDFLVTEMHHRVKNILQIVNSLINTQLTYTTSEAGKEALLRSRHRFFSLSLVHQKLFQTSMISCLEVNSYIVELVDYLADEFNVRERIKFQYDLCTLCLDIEQAIPLGLIINELVTNSLKYAFPSNTPGLIKISLVPVAEDSYRFEFSDNGIGFPADFDFMHDSSLGGTLISGLSGQLRARFKVLSDQGVKVTLDFNTNSQRHLAAS